MCGKHVTRGNIYHCDTGVGDGKRKAFQYRSSCLEPYDVPSTKASVSLPVFGSVLWKPNLLKDIKTLERLQRRATRYILNDYIL